MSDESIHRARLIREQRYADATVVFAAGSLIRGEGTAYADLDLVIVYPELPCAYRESFRFQGYPVEAFVHDPETLNYFLLEVDRPSGVPALAHMVVEGVELPEPTEHSRALKALAASVLALGPPPLTPQELEKRRYGITDLLDDLRDPRSREELVGTGAQLFNALADYHLRARGLWSGSDKSVPRALRSADAALCVRYCASFEELFTKSDARAVIGLAEKLLGPDGGPLFEGYRSEAPANWRKAPAATPDETANVPGPDNSIEIGVATAVDDELVDAFARLVPQLSQTAAIPTRDLLKNIVEADATTLLLARDLLDNRRIVGTLTLVAFRIPTGLRARIEDVVVDETARGRGVGEALSRDAVDRATRMGARTVELTSRPSREAANRLYQRLGFILRDGNVYRYTP